MKTLTKSLFTLVILLSYAVVYAQPVRIEEAIEDENYTRVIKIAEKYMEEDEFRKDPYVYYYHALGLYEMFKDPYFAEDNPDAIKEAVKSVQKAQKYDSDSSVTRQFLDFIDELAVKQNDLAMDQYRINKHTKAIKMFEDSYELNQNRMAYNMVAKCALAMYDTTIAISHYKTLIDWYNIDLLSAAEEPEQETDAHIFFINKYWEKKNYDSAYYFLDNAREIFGNDAKIDFYQKSISLEHINTMPPSSLMMEYLKKNIALFPTDTNFLHKENALYIYQIKNGILAERYDEVDTLLEQFAREKVARSASPDATQIMYGDDFVAKKTENVYWKLSEYFQTYGHPISAKYVLSQYIRKTAKADTAPEIAARWLVISDFAFQTKALPFAAFVLQQSIINTKQNKDLLAFRTKIITEKNANKLDVNEAAAIYSLMKDEYATKKTEDNLKLLEGIGDNYISLLVQSVRFGTAYEVVAELMRFNPKRDYNNQLRFLAQEDFYQNYFLTKTKGKNASGEEVEGFIWDGSIGSCEAGTVEAVIQQKVLDRINYFRRNAGVPEVLFDAATNDYCQQAALMMESNNKVDHNPAKSWRCYTDEGAYAAKHSLLVKNANTTIAVTSLMADQSNPTVGNRRWLLYPNGRIYGHGSTANNAVIWALDDSGSTDTAEYMEKAVCWPPAGYIPQMMLFKHWSFSLYQSLDSATVELTQDGKAIPVKVEKYVDGYGAPTLVFTPDINTASLPENANFEVNVTLSNGRKYSYTVHTFSYDPNKL